jgi:hypothetical protein
LLFRQPATVRQPNNASKRILAETGPARQEILKALLELLAAVGRIFRGCL